MLDRDVDIDISDDTDMEDVIPPRMSRLRGGRARDGDCLGRISELERALGRVEGMVKMLVALGGLAGPEERLEIEKCKGRMAREWDESIARAGERAKAEAIVKAADKCMKKRELDDARAEEGRLQQEGLVRVKEAARVAAEAERDTLVIKVKECAEGSEAVAAAEKVVDAARMVVELEREVAASAAPVEIRGWQVAGGRKRKTVQVVSQLCRPLDGERRKSLQEAVSQVQGLIGAASLGWGVVALPYTVHGGDEILWTVRGVVEETNGSEVANVILKNLEAVWGVGSLVGCWVDNKGSAYVVVRVIPEREWLSNKGGVQGLVDGNPGIMWGPRQPTVTNRVWNTVDVKVEIMTAEAAKGTVVWGLVYCGTSRTVHMAAGGGGASVLRQGLQTSTVEIGVRRPLATRATAYGPLRVSGVSARPVGACFWCKKNGHWKNECPDGPGVLERGCFTCGLWGHISRFCLRRVEPSVGQEGAVTGKERGEHGPEEKRMGPNERGWLEAQNRCFDDERIRKTMEKIDKTGGPSGARSWMGVLSVACMNVGRGCVATHAFLESCARKEVGLCFVGECWVALAGSGTQSHPEYVMLGSASRGTKVVVFVRKDLVDGVSLVAATVRVVVVEVGGCRIGRVYGKCGVGVHTIGDWLFSLEGWIGGGDWVLLGDWNAHHHTWSQDGRSGPGGRVLPEWVLKRSAEIHFGEGEHSRGDEVVAWYSLG